MKFSPGLITQGERGNGSHKPLSVIFLGIGFIRHTSSLGSFAGYFIESMIACAEVPIANAIWCISHSLVLMMSSEKLISSAVCTPPFSEGKSSKCGIEDNIQ